MEQVTIASNTQRLLQAGRGWREIERLSANLGGRLDGLADTVR
jgi:hypothetical protein